MATEIIKDKYGQLELNQVAWRRDGRIEAQCALSSDFNSAPAENGMLLAVDKSKGEVKLATATLAATLPIGIHYSTEHMYDDRTSALKEFALYPGEFLPRVGYLSVGDTFTTNTVYHGYDNDGLFNTAVAALPGTAMYGEVQDAAPGFIVLVATIAATAGPTFRVIKKTTMPDGSDGYKLQVLSV